jgi:hypothetical protein
MLAWEGFNRAKAASYAEAARIGDVYNLSAGFADPEKSSMLAYEYEDKPIEIIFDHLEKVASKLEKATEYAEADRYYGKSLAKVLPTPLRKELTLRRLRRAGGHRGMGSASPA